jgi:hypothetical protein
MNDLFDLLWENSYKINASMWATVYARLVLPNININQEPAKQFPPSVKKGEYFDVPDGIIAHLTREYGGNVHDRQAVAIRCGSLEKETQGANPHSVAYYNADWAAAKNAADLETDLIF